MRIILFLILFFAVAPSKAQTEADFCVTCGTSTDTESKKAEPLGDIAKSIKSDFDTAMVLDPEVVENTDSRQLGEMIVSRLKKRCDNSRDPSKKELSDSATDIVMLVPSQNLEAILKYGFKNQHQTSTTKGSDAKQLRLSYESMHVLMALPYTDKMRTLLPKYAMEVLHDQKVGTYYPPFQYGTIMIRFKPEVKKRATWSPNDSLSYAKPLRSQTLRPAQGMECMGYCEAQIWGDLDASDIQAVIIPDGSSDDLKEKAKQFGVDVYSYKTKGSAPSYYSGYDSVPKDPSDLPPSGVFKDSTINAARVDDTPLYKASGAVKPPEKITNEQAQNLMETADSVVIRNIMTSRVDSQKSTEDLLKGVNISDLKVEGDGYLSGWTGKIGDRKVRQVAELTTRKKTPEVVDALTKVLQQSNDPGIRAIALSGLHSLPWKDLKPLLLDAMKASDNSNPYGGSGMGMGTSPYSSGSSAPSDIRPAQDILGNMTRMIAAEHLDDTEVMDALKKSPGGEDFLKKTKDNTLCAQENYSE